MESDGENNGRLASWLQSTKQEQMLGWRRIPARQVKCDRSSAFYSWRAGVGAATGSGRGAVKALEDRSPHAKAQARTERSQASEAALDEGVSVRHRARTVDAAQRTAVDHLALVVRLLRSSSMRARLSIATYTHTSVASPHSGVGVGQSGVRLALIRRPADRSKSTIAQGRAGGRREPMTKTWVTLSVASSGVLFSPSKGASGSVRSPLDTANVPLVEPCASAAHTVEGIPFRQGARSSRPARGSAMNTMHATVGGASTRRRAGSSCWRPQEKGRVVSYSRGSVARGTHDGRYKARVQKSGRRRRRGRGDRQRPTVGRASRLADLRMTGVSHTDFCPIRSAPA